MIIVSKEDTSGNGSTLRLPQDVWYILSFNCISSKQIVPDVDQQLNIYCQKSDVGKESRYHDFPLINRRTISHGIYIFTSFDTKPFISCQYTSISLLQETEVFLASVVQINLFFLLATPDSLEIVKQSYYKEICIGNFWETLTIKQSLDY